MRKENPNRKRSLPPPKIPTTQPLSGSRMADSGQLDFAIERDYDPEAQVMGMELEGIDAASRRSRPPPV